MFAHISRTDFHDAFRDYNRLENFSYEGRDALFEWLEEYEECCEEPVELDVIALCCDFSEYNNIEEYREDYGKDKDFTLDDLMDETTVIIVGEGFIIHAY